MSGRQGGKLKPLKAPKKETKELDDVRIAPFVPFLLACVFANLSLPSLFSRVISPLVAC
jgi:hypothetical protein